MSDEDFGGLEAQVNAAFSDTILVDNHRLIHAVGGVHEMMHALGMAEIHDLASPALPLPETYPETDGGMQNWIDDLGEWLIVATQYVAGFLEGHGLNYLQVWTRYDCDGKFHLFGLMPSEESGQWTLRGD